MSTKNCSVCHAELTCGATREDQVCWCNQFPKIMPLESGQDCLCKSCLAKAIAKRIDESIRLNGYEQMLKLANEYRNQSTLIEHLDYTIENGLYVFTKWYHLKRGACCGNGCRNCPYQSLQQLE